MAVSQHLSEMGKLRERHAVRQLDLFQCGLLCWQLFNPHFRDLQYVFFQEKHGGLAEEDYPDIKRLMYDLDNHSPNLLSTLPALMDSPGDRIAPQAPSIVKRVFNSAQHFSVGTPNNI